MNRLHMQFVDYKRAHTGIKEKGLKESSYVTVKEARGVCLF